MESMLNPSAIQKAEQILSEASMQRKEADSFATLLQDPLNRKILEVTQALLLTSQAEFSERMEAYKALPMLKRFLTEQPQALAFIPLEQVIEHFPLTQQASVALRMDGILRDAGILIRTPNEWDGYYEYVSQEYKVSEAALAYLDDLKP